MCGGDIVSFRDGRQCTRVAVADDSKAVPRRRCLTLGRVGTFAGTYSLSVRASHKVVTACFVDRGEKQAWKDFKGL